MKKKFLKIIFSLFLLLLVFILICNFLIENNAKGKIFTDVNKIPENKVGVVLGTSKRTISGDVNLYFKYRINAAVELFMAGKIDFILVSGDNSEKYYNEPKDFRKELIKRGIPSTKIFLDYAGFRTLDSMVRLKEIFDQTKVTIISQEFHNERAIYLAESFNIEAIAFNAKSVSLNYGFKVKLREYLARTKVFIDLIFNVEPKFLGKKIIIE